MFSVDSAVNCTVNTCFRVTPMKNVFKDFVCALGTIPI